ncbi:MAG: peptidoglycan DD-metalloendopeptidase family protein [Acutalibacteraceae bacterium]|nr:M23 family metallopeptidase [Oscillospiraceae bacterium]
MNNKSSFQKTGNKSFYIILSIALVAVIAATVVITYTSGKIKSKIAPKTTAPSSEQSSYPSTVGSEDVNTPKNDVEDTRHEKDSTEQEETSEKSETTEKATSKTDETTSKNISCCLPVGTQILKDYSNGAMVKSKTMNDWRLHNGVDFTGEVGDDVHAVYDGSVTKIYNDGLWGKVVEIDHGNGMKAKYCGFEEIGVKENDEVKKDQVIGTLGNIPIESADNTHLHLEITINGKITDPIAALGKESAKE